MSALDVALVLGLVFWPRRNSVLGMLGGVVLFSGLGLLGIVLISIIFRTNPGQCAVEGIAYHGSLFLLVVGGVLFYRRLRFPSLLSALLGLFVFGIGFNMLVWEPYNLVAERYSFETSKLTKPLRIVFVSDIQTDRIGEYERRTLRMIQEQNPDLILFGGDYLQYYEGTPGVADLSERFLGLFAEAELSAPLGVFAIPGNNDPSDSEGFSKLFAGTTVEPIFFSEIIENLGVDLGRDPIDISFLHLFDAIDGVGERGLTETGNFQIMIGHYPNFAIKDYMHSERAPALMLAGHTHGGQIYVPGFGPLRINYTGRNAITPASMYRGMFAFGNGSRLLVTRGTGMECGWAPRVRFLCKPEISVIDVLPK